MSVPSKYYTVRSVFDVNTGRWKARFESEQYPGVAYEFPLADTPVYDGNRPFGGFVNGSREVTSAEERLFALTFIQMVKSTVENMRNQQQLVQQQQVPSETQRTLVE